MRFIKPDRNFDIDAIRSEKIFSAYYLIQPVPRKEFDQLIVTLFTLSIYPSVYCKKQANKNLRFGIKFRIFPYTSTVLQVNNQIISYFERTKKIIIHKFTKRLHNSIYFWIGFKYKQKQSVYNRGQYIILFSF